MNLSMPVTGPQRVFGTFGIYRYVLACLVILTHLGPRQYGTVGLYAVFAFYILSGYVASFILHHTYLPLPGGLRKFAINRFLRIFPLYWVVMACTLPLLMAFPHEALQISTFHIVPQDIRDWAWNILAIGMVNPITGALYTHDILPVSWSLGVELIWWALIPKILIDSGLRRTLLYCSIGYTVCGIVFSIGLQRFAPSFQFWSAMAASLPFCTGVLLLMRKNRNHFVIPHSFGVITMIMFVVFIRNAPSFYTDPSSVEFFIGFIINVLLVAYLSQIDRKSLPMAVQKLDDFLGNLAYPIYLVHLPLGLAVHVMLPSLSVKGWTIWAIVTILSSVTALILYHAVELPVNSIRRRMKHA